MFKAFGGDISEKITEYEKVLKMQFPEDYKQFLIKTNGGEFQDDIQIFWVDELQEDIAIDLLFGFEHVRSLNLLDWYKEYSEELPENTIIIGDSINAGLILLIWQDDWQGIFLWDHCLELEQSTEEDCLYRIADTFEMFLNSLRYNF